MESENEQTIYVSSRFGRNDKLMYATTKSRATVLG